MVATAVSADDVPRAKPNRDSKSHASPVALSRPPRIQPDTRTISSPTQNSGTTKMIIGPMSGFYLRDPSQGRIPAAFKATLELHNLACSQHQSQRDCCNHYLAQRSHNERTDSLFLHLLK